MTSEVSRRQLIAAATLAGGAAALAIPAAAAVAAPAPDKAPGNSPTIVYNLEVWLLSTSPQ